MYKKIILPILLILLSVSVTFSQVRTNDQRTVSTKVADLVMKLPAKSTVEFNTLMKELLTYGDLIPTMANSLTAPGVGDDTQTRYAIAGMALYASKSKSADRTAVANGLCKAIEQAKSDEIRDFLFIQLILVAGDESVATAAKYLSNDRLCDAAARVLVGINSENSKKALHSALNGATGAKQITLIEALGDVSYEPALADVTKLAASTDANVKKVALYTLAKIASPSSESILLAEAAKAGYSFNKTDALKSYTTYLNNLNTNGNKVLAAKSAKHILKVASGSKQSFVKGAALKVLVDAEGDKAIPEVVKAIGSDNQQYRQAALWYSQDIKSAAMSAALIKKADKEKNAAVKADVLTALGLRGDKLALPVALKAINDKNPVVIAAAVTAAGKLGKEDAISPIIRAMSLSSDANVVSASKAALLAIGGENTAKSIASAIPQSSSAGRVAMTQALAQFKAVNHSEPVFLQAESNDATVRNEACIALKDLVTEKDIARIAKMLNASKDDKDASVLQSVLYSAVKNSGEKSNQTKLVVEQMNAAPAKHKYYTTLAMIGDEKALDVVKTAFTSSDKTIKNSAIDALANWSNASATNELFAIAKENTSGEFFDKSLNAYVSKIIPSKNTPDQKLLLLRKALSIAKTADQKKVIISEIAKTRTFLAMVVAGQYLDDASLQQVAAQAVKDIALSNNKYHGKKVTELLNKVIAVNKHEEADYQKQAILKHLAALPQGNGYVSMFNGKDLSGWKGLVENPIARAKMKPAELAAKQVKADEIMRRDWFVENGLLVFEGKGYDNLCSEKNYGDFEMVVDWRIEKEGDAGIYLRGTPQVQIWDTSLVKVGAQVGSGGLYNNGKHESKPLLVADNAVEEWNTFRIRMVGEKVTIYLNGQLVTDNVILENYWDRKLPIFSEDAIELQAHGTRVEYRDVYVCEIPRPEPYKVSAEELKDGFVPLFNGVDMSGWIGNTQDYIAENGAIVCDPKYGGHGNLFTDKEYGDFILRFDFQLTPGANNGLGIRTPLEGDAAYAGMELQILDNDADIYKTLETYQYHGSVYGVMEAKRGHLKPLGEWNHQEVVVNGNQIKVTLNGVVILDGDLAKATKNFTETLDKLNHPGLKNKKGYIAFLGHGSYVKFKELRIKDLSKPVLKGKRK